MSLIGSSSSLLSSSSSTTTNNTTSEYVCSICSDFFRNPVATKCKEGSHVFCHVCLITWLKTKNTCPICRSIISTNEQDYKVVYMIKNIIDQLNCSCSRGECDWKGTMLQLSKHLANECKYYEILCPNSDNGCKERTLNITKNTHIAVCPYQKISCSLCKENILRKDEKTHIDTNCLMAPILCSQCHTKTTRGLINSHQSDECPETEIKCDFSRYGCTHICKRKYKNEHLINFSQKHIQSVDECVNTLTYLRIGDDKMINLHSDGPNKIIIPFFQGNVRHGITITVKSKTVKIHSIY